MLRGSRRYLAYGRSEAGRTVARHDYRVDAGRIGGPHAGSQVMGILYPVKHQQQRNLAGGQLFLNHRSQAGFIKHCRAAHLCHDSLVSSLATDLLKPGAISRQDIDA